MKGRQVPRPADYGQSAVASLFASYPEVTLAYLYGSQARGEAGAQSDYDFGVLVSWEKDVLARRGEIRARLAHELAVALAVAGDRVDLVILNRVPVELAYAVIAEGRIVFERDVASRVEYEAYVLGHYGDYLPVLRAQRRAILEGGGYEARAERYREAFGRARRAPGEARPVRREAEG